MPAYTVDPVRIFELKGNVSTLLVAPGTAYAVGNNRQILAAVSAQRIRVMGLIAQTVAGGGEGTFNLKSASGGTALFPNFYAPLPTTASIFFLPITESGYCETNTGEGLFTDIAVANVTIQVFYITYTP